MIGVAGYPTPTAAIFFSVKARTAALKLNESSCQIFVRMCGRDKMFFCFCVYLGQQYKVLLTYVSLENK